MDDINFLKLNFPCALLTHALHFFCKCYCYYIVQLNVSFMIIDNQFQTNPFYQYKTRQKGLEKTNRTCLYSTLKVCSTPTRLIRKFEKVQQSSLNKTRAQR